MTTAPAARPGLTVTDLDGERVIFDAATNEAHKLGSYAGDIFAACDGKTGVEQIAASLGLTVEQVESACAELAHARLIEVPAGLSRRRMLQGGAVAGALLVSTVVIPNAAAAVSKFGPGPGEPGGAPGTTTSLIDAIDPTTGALSSPFSVTDGTNPLDGGFTLSDGSGGSVAGYTGNDGGGEPHFYVTGSGGYHGGTLDMPPNSIGLHPGPVSPVLLAIANTTGHVASITVMGSITNRDTVNGGGADGVRLSVLDSSKGTANVSGPKATAATAGVFNSTDTFNATVHLVPANGSAYISVNHGSNYGYETTLFTLTVTVA